MINSLFYLGSLNPNSNSFRRFETYKQIIVKVEGLDIDPFIYHTITKKFDHHLNFGWGTIKLNTALRSIDFSNMDVLLIDNRPFIFKNTFQFLRRKYPKLKIALVLTDDPNGKYKSGWRLLKKTAELIDIHFVQRKQNVEELLSWGARKVEMCYRSYDPSFHRKKSTIKKNEKFDAGFIGSYEEQREEAIRYLIENGIKVLVIGDGWEKGKYFDIIKPYYDGGSVLLEIIKTHSDLLFECFGAYEFKNSNLGGSGDVETTAFIAALQQAPNVVLHGMVKPEVLAQELRRMDAFLICYDVEKDQSKGTNYHKVMEYLAYGRPIVSNNISAHAENLSILQPQNTMNHGSRIINVFQNFISDQKKYVLHSNYLKGYKDLLIKIFTTVR